MSAHTLIVFHTLLCLIAIGFGAMALASLFNGLSGRFWQPGFIALAVASSATGFILPLHGITPPPVVVGVLALTLLAVVIVAYYRQRRHSAWSRAYAAGIVASLYLLVFVGVAQAFLKIPALHALSPTGGGPVFAMAQGAVLVGFVVLGIAVTRVGHPRVVT